MSVSGVRSAANSDALATAVPPASVSTAGASTMSLTGGVDTLAATLSHNVPIGSVAVPKGHSSGLEVSTTVGIAAGVVGTSSI